MIMNAATLFVLLLVLLALVFALREMFRPRKAPAGKTAAPREDSCCNCAGCSLRSLCKK